MIVTINLSTIMEYIGVLACFMPIFIIAGVAVIWMGNAATSGKS